MTRAAAEPAARGGRRGGACSGPACGRRPASPASRRSPSCRWLVYILRCGDGSLYTGITNDLQRRLEAHAAGRASRYTRSRLPVAVVHVEHRRSKSAALKREAAIKRLPRAEKERLFA